MEKTTGTQPLTLQDLYNIGYTAHVINDEGPGWNETEERCSYLYGCAIGRAPFLSDDDRKLLDEAELSGRHLVSSDARVRGFLDSNERCAGNVMPEEKEGALFELLSRTRAGFNIEGGLLNKFQSVHDKAAKRAAEGKEAFRTLAKEGYEEFAQTMKLSSPETN